MRIYHVNESKHCPRRRDRIFQQLTTMQRNPLCNKCYPSNVTKPKPCTSKSIAPYHVCKPPKHAVVEVEEKRSSGGSMHYCQSQSRPGSSKIEWQSSLIDAMVRSEL
jgi:hypothetical protein